MNILEQERLAHFELLKTHISVTAGTEVMCKDGLCTVAEMEREGIIFLDGYTYYPRSAYYIIRYCAGSPAVESRIYLGVTK